MKNGITTKMLQAMLDGKILKDMSDNSALRIVNNRLEFNGDYKATKGWIEPIHNNLNEYPYEIIPNTRTITIDDKQIEISEESYQALKKSLLQD